MNSTPNERSTISYFNSSPDFRNQLPQLDIPPYQSPLIHNIIHEEEEDNTPISLTSTHTPITPTSPNKINVQQTVPVFVLNPTVPNYRSRHSSQRSSRQTSQQQTLTANSSCADLLSRQPSTQDLLQQFNPRKRSNTTTSMNKSPSNMFDNGINSMQLHKRHKLDGTGAVRPEFKATDLVGSAYNVLAKHKIELKLHLKKYSDGVKEHDFDDELDSHMNQILNKSNPTFKLNQHKKGKGKIAKILHPNDKDHFLEEF